LSTHGVELSTDIEIAERDVREKQRVYDSEENEDIRRAALFRIYKNADFTFLLSPRAGGHVRFYVHNT
jgi:hypothetical protein